MPSAAIANSIVPADVCGTVRTCAAISLCSLSPIACGRASSRPRLGEDSRVGRRRVGGVRPRAAGAGGSASPARRGHRDSGGEDGKRWTSGTSPKSDASCYGAGAGSTVPVPLNDPCADLMIPAPRLKQLVPLHSPSLQSRQPKSNGCVATTVCVTGIKAWWR